MKAFDAPQVETKVLAASNVIAVDECKFRPPYAIISYSNRRGLFKIGKDRRTLPVFWGSSPTTIK